uniref:Uncharacterized protein n=1 Tax=Arabidopsis thaliana TaxID=3702 RepID=Q0WM24_ARATH|nr:hypothetical protein [Arabidopsis thaliana]
MYYFPKRNEIYVMREPTFPRSGLLISKRRIRYLPLLLTLLARYFLF